MVPTEVSHSLRKLHSKVNLMLLSNLVFTLNMSSTDIPVSVMVRNKYIPAYSMTNILYIHNGNRSASTGVFHTTPTNQCQADLGSGTLFKDTQFQQGSGRN